MSEKNHLNVLSFGLAIGVVAAIFLFLFGVGAWIFDIGRPYIELISSILIGYASTFLGSIIGAIWGFIFGFIEGVLIAWFYNLFQGVKQ